MSATSQQMQDRRGSGFSDGGDLDGDSNPSSDAPLNNLAQDMFKKTADYLQGELLLVMVNKFLALASSS